MEDQTDFIVQCTCGDTKDHVIHCSFYDDEQWSTVTISPALNHYKGFFGRLKVGLKYIFGMDNTFFHYVETVVPDKDLEPLGLWLIDCHKKVKAAQVAYEGKKVLTSN